MMISDIIANEIIKMIDDSTDNSTELRRNDFAKQLGCSPSQINYVISTRFTPEHGYVITSRRGGGGFLKISRVTIGRLSRLMHIVNTIGDSIDELSMRVLIDNCVHSAVISDENAKIIMAAVSPAVMRQIPPQFRDTIRASILKQTFLSLISAV